VEVTERFGLGVTNCRPVDGVIRAVREAESLGAEIAFIAEDINCRDAFELAALSARETSRIRLSTGVVNPYTRNPTSLAMAIATLDEVSDGRASLGLGTSSPSLIEGQMGIPSAGSVAVMREATEIVGALLSGDVVTYAGRRFFYTDAKLDIHPVQPRIPIFYAAMGPKMLELAGRLADGVLLNVGASTEYTRWAVDEIERSARSFGRDPAEVTIAAWLTAYIVDDYAEGLQKAKEWLAGMLSIPRQGELLLERAGFDASILEGIRQHHGAYPHRGDKEAAARFIPDEVAESLALVGTKEQVRDRVVAYRSAGVQVPVLGIGSLRALYSDSRMTT
jgi:5,10-methylenetetrahydromethanopterin reductase